MTDLVFEVLGKPRPKGSMEAVGPWGRGGMKEDNPESGPWRERVAWAAFRAIAASKQAGESFVKITGPVEVRAVFSFERPKSYPKLTKVWPVTRSTYDLDKLVRNVFDALKDAQVVGDDSQVVRLTAEKTYCGEHPAALSLPGATILVRSVAPTEDDHAQQR